MGMSKLLSFAKRVPNTNRFPQVLVIYSSGYLRLKAGADPTPPLSFGQSLVLGPAISGTTTSFRKRTLFFHPQLQRVTIDTSQLSPNGTGGLLIQITSSRSSFPNSAVTNQIMNLSWALILEDPSNLATTLHVAGTFELTEDVLPDPAQTEKFESVRLLQISTMYIDNVRHDVNALRFLTGRNVMTLCYDPALANLLLPVSPSPLDLAMPMFDSIHTDDVGQPNGNTPSYRLKLTQLQAP